MILNLDNWLARRKPLYDFTTIFMVYPLWDHQKGDTTYGLRSIRPLPSSVIIPVQQPNEYVLTHWYGRVYSDSDLPTNAESIIGTVNAFMRGDSQSIGWLGE